MLLDVAAEHRFSPLFWADNAKSWGRMYHCCSSTADLTMMLPG